ncbi:hypothetical protein VNO77_39295 [Canavalia gladiata]|uniref:Uncharacterized protein n=1 Tax=Canavalia gladiata TaxID=3824 RepID=A0AAN9KAU1_CANGL
MTRSEVHPQKESEEFEQGVQHMRLICYYIATLDIVRGRKLTCWKLETLQWRLLLLPMEGVSALELAGKGQDKSSIQSFYWAR